MIPRRRFLAGLGALLCAPAIVRVSAIMPVKAMPVDLLSPAMDATSLVQITGNGETRTIFSVWAKTPDTDGWVYLVSDESGRILLPPRHVIERPFITFDAPASATP